LQATHVDLVQSVLAHWAQVYLNKVNEKCFARIACKLELMQPCARCAQASSHHHLAVMALVDVAVADHFLTSAWASGHSVKDRIALNMIRRAEEQGLISPEHTTLVPPTTLKPHQPACCSGLHRLPQRCRCCCFTSRLAYTCSLMWQRVLVMVARLCAVVLEDKENCC